MSEGGGLSDAAGEQAIREYTTAVLVRNRMDCTKTTVRLDDTRQLFW